ncbi:MAG: hypothetical protein ABSD27_08150 [Bryobacteraceae bacterium]
MFRLRKDTASETGRQTARGAATASSRAVLPHRILALFVPILALSPPASAKPARRRILAPILLGGFRACAPRRPRSMRK